MEKFTPSLQRVLHTFKHILHSPQPDGEGRRTHIFTHRHAHTAPGAALWVLSVHNMAAIILLAAAAAAAAEAWGQAGVGSGRMEGVEKGAKKLASKNRRYSQRKVRRQQPGQNKTKQKKNEGGRQMMREV